VKKPPKRIRKRHPLMPDRLPGRLHRVYFDAAHPRYILEIRIARTNRHMRTLGHRDGDPIEPECMGLVRHYVKRIGGARSTLRNGVVASMWLNRRDLTRKPSEIVSHECTHAAMAWARLRGEHLLNMRSEEVLCYAVGRLVAQVNRVCYAERVW
jgi:hypothetical protein